MYNGKLGRVQQNNGGILNEESYGDHPWEKFSQTWEVDTGGEGKETYVVSFPQVLDSVACTVEECLDRPYTPVRLRHI